MGNRPNILFILTDDQGYWTLRCNGNHEILTPNIDRLAATGVRCENFFCASPVCSPARASLLTGRIPSQHGIHDWLRNGNDPAKGPTIEYLEGIPGFTDYLAQQGYACGLSGKWHMGDSCKPQKSFTHWYATMDGSNPYHDATVIKNGELTTEKAYLTDAITDDAMAFITECCEKGVPFCSYVSYTAPHSPMVDQHPAKYVDYYTENCTFIDSPQDPRHPWMQKYPIDIQYSEMLSSRERTSVSIRDLIAGYYAAISAVDDNVGRLMGKLEELGVRGNTLVIYASDNGFSCGRHGIWGKGNATFPNNMYDTSVKVPAIFNQPGVVREGVVTQAMLSAYDLMPTLLEYAGVDNPEAEKLPGRSFLKVLTDGEQEVNDRVVVYDEYGPVRMVRTREWKYVHRYPYGPHELYDLRRDPDEYWNLLDEGRNVGYTQAEIDEKVREMKQSLDEWFAEYVDPNLDGKGEPVTGRGQLCKVGRESKGNLTFSPWIATEYTRK